MISENVEKIRTRIAGACARAGRDPREVTLVAVTKTFPPEVVREAIRAGIPDIGENYVQELLEKRGVLAAEDVRWHFIGHLQTNKVKQIAGWVAMVHALDSPALAAELERRGAQAGRVIDCLIEVNTTGEGSKFGVSPEKTIDLVRSLAGLRNVRLAGLMTIGPFLPDPAGSRPMFRTLRELRDEAARLGQPNAGMEHLSMGMTGDFEVAIEEGATMVRIGTALFGRRTRKT